MQAVKGLNKKYISRVYIIKMSFNSLDYQDPRMMYQTPLQSEFVLAFRFVLSPYLFLPSLCCFLPCCCFPVFIYLLALFFLIGILGCRIYLICLPFFFVLLCFLFYFVNLCDSEVLSSLLQIVAVHFYLEEVYFSNDFPNERRYITNISLYCLF